MRRPRPWAIGFGLLLTLLFAAPTAVFFAIRHHESADAQKSLELAIREVSAIDPHWRWHDLTASRESEGVTIAKELSDFGTSVWGGRSGAEDRVDHFFDRMQFLPEKEMPDPDWALQLEEALDRLQVPLEIARDFRNQVPGACKPTLQPNLMGSPMPHLIGLRYAGRILRGDAMRQTIAGNTELAEQDLQSLFQSIRVIRHDPVIVSQIAHQSVMTEAARCVERILGISDQSQPLVEWQAFFAEQLRHRSVQTAMRGERAWWHGLFEKIEADEIDLKEVLTDYAPFSGMNIPPEIDAYRIKPRVPHAHAEMLRWFTEVVAIAEQPLHLQRRAQRSIDVPSSPSHPILSQMYRQPADSMLHIAQSSNTVTGCMVAALACERYRIDHSAWPTSLNDLIGKYLDAVPLDPFDGMPLRYLKLADGVCVYGVGFDGSDNDGNLSDFRYSGATDLGVRLWNADERRAPGYERLAMRPKRVE